MEDSLKIKKHLLTRTMNFLFLIPFILGFRPLILRYSRLDMILYSLGTFIITLLIIISNRSPYIVLNDNRIVLNLHYYQKPEIHLIERITLVEKISGHSIRIHSLDYKPVRININPPDVHKILKFFIKKGIKIN